MSHGHGWVFKTLNDLASLLVRGGKWCGALFRISDPISQPSCSDMQFTGTSPSANRSEFMKYTLYLIPHVLMMLVPCDLSKIGLSGINHQVDVS